MEDNSPTSLPKPADTSRSCTGVILPILVALLVIVGIIRFSTGNTEAGVFMIVVGFTLLLIYPVGYIARIVCSGKLGDLMKGDSMDHPILQTKRFTFSIREENRPWLILWLILFITGWGLDCMMINYVN